MDKRSKAAKVSLRSGPESHRLFLRSPLVFARDFPNGKWGIAAFFGTWPGDETDQELAAVLRDSTVVKTNVDSVAIERLHLSHADAHGLLQWLNLTERLMPGGPLPILHQLTLVLCRPLHYKPLRSRQE